MIVYRKFIAPSRQHPIDQGYQHYVLMLAFGSLLGATALGTANLWISDVPGLGRSILGSLLGAIIGIEWYKHRHGLRQSTGAAFVVPLALGIAVGRIGCLLSGLDDYTYGSETTLPWGWDFGDGLNRHPVQIYESISMGGFLLGFLALLKLRPQIAIKSGFYLFAAWYGIQRFGLEFMKPYGELIGPFNIFHLGCIILLVYALNMMGRANRA